MTLSPQALWHDLMAAALLETIHECMINTNIQNSKMERVTRGWGCRFK